MKNVEFWKSFQSKIENFLHFSLFIEHFKLSRLPVFLALWALFGHQAIHAQQLTSGADFLKIGSGARSEGMGGAFTAVADDVNALTYNPAGLALLKYPEVGYLRMIYVSDVAYNFGGAAIPMAAGENTWGFGLGIINLGTPSFDSTMGLAPAVSAGDNSFFASVAFRLKDQVAFGITGKYIMRTIAGYNANAFGGDLGVLITPVEHLRIGLGAFNVGQQVQFISAGDPLPSTARLGLAYQLLDIPQHSLLLSVDNGYQWGSQTYIGAAGAEYWYDKTLALRVGYTGDAYEQNLTAGLGVNVDMLEFDYAYAPLGTLGDTHRFSLIVRFGTEGAGGLAGPRDFMAHPSNGSVALTWKPASSSSVLGYNILVKKPGAESFAKVTKTPLGPTETQVKLNHRVNGQEYGFAIQTVSEGGRESSLVQISAVPGEASPPAASLQAPTGFKPALNATGDGFELTWDPATNAAGYNLYLADDQGKRGQKLNAEPLTVNRTHLTHVNPTRTYSFVLTTIYTTGGESPTTPVLQVSLPSLKTASTPQLLPPAHLVLQMAEGKVQMNWDAVSGVTKYNIYVSHDGKNFNLLTKDGLAQTHATLGPLKAGLTYIFGVSSLSPDGKESDKTVQTLPAQ
jgi:hypothetical protein